MLDFLAEVLLELLAAFLPPRAANALAVLMFFLGGIACFTAGGWVLYRVATAAGERSDVWLTLIAWLSGCFFLFLARKMRKDH